MNGPPVDPLELEPYTDRAWPPLTRAKLGEWRLNATTGWSARINACWALGDTEMDEAMAVAAVETWYRQRGLPPKFKLLDERRSHPALAERLVASGYQPNKETIVMVRPAGSSGGDDVELADDAGEDFQAVFAAAAVNPGDAEERLGALARVPHPRRLAIARWDGAAAAIGACAVEAPWAGIFAMRTAPEHRRKGMARRVLQGLLGAAHRLGAERAWLQVEAANLTAVRLYACEGFEEAYRYRYFTLN